MPTCTSFFKGLSKTWLVAVNVITLLLGVAVTGCSIFLLAKYSDLSSEHFYTKRAAVCGIVAGLLTAAFSLLGCLSSKKQNKCGLGVYSVGMTIMMLILLSGGIVGLIFVGKMDPDDLNNTKLSELSSDIMKDILNYELNIYNKCCQDGTPVEMCSSSSSQNWCIDDEENIDGSICTALKKIKYDGTNDLISEDNKCGTSEDFTKNIHEFFHKYFTPISIVFIVLCSIQLLCIVFSCCLMCMNREDYDVQYRKRLEEQKLQAGQMTGTGQPTYGAGAGNQYV